MRLLAYALVFLALTAEVEGEIYGGAWSTPYMAVGTFLFKPSAIKLPIWDLLVLDLLFAGWSASRAPRPLARAVQITLGAVVFEWLWGVATGGSVQQTLWQLHPFILMFAVAYALIGALRDTADFVTLGQVILWSAIFRAAMLLGFYQWVVKETMPFPPPTLTTHQDTALFVSGLIVIFVWLFEHQSLANLARVLVPAAMILASIVYNNRRLAWVSFLGVLAVIYAMFPPTRQKRRLNQLALALTPLFLVYLAVGWDRTEPIFKLAHSIATMTGKEDAPAATRDIENYNLIATLKHNPLIGVGFGKEYDEVSVAYSIKEFFEQYRYIPHNSVLGLLGFTGLFGFAGIWCFLPVTGYFLSRGVREAQSKPARLVALAALAEMAVFMNQLYGDMGLISMTTIVLMACSIAAAARLPRVR